jgi:hypothetical protein
MMLLMPSAAWAHDCGPETLSVKKGGSVAYAITGKHYIDTQIINKGDPLVAKIEPPKNSGEEVAVFKIVGTGIGTTEFKIDWDGEYRRGGCYVEVTVSK